MAWVRRWRISSRHKWQVILKALMDMPFDFEHRPIELIVREERKEKTDAQRGLWHATLADFGKALGYTMLEMKGVVKREYYGAQVKTLPNGMKFEVVQSSEDEDREGYSALIDFTLRFAAEQGIVLQDRRTK